MLSSRQGEGATVSSASGDASMSTFVKLHVDMEFEQLHVSIVPCEYLVQLMKASKALFGGWQWNWVNGVAFPNP